MPSRDRVLAVRKSIDSVQLGGGGNVTARVAHSHVVGPLAIPRGANQKSMYILDMSTRKSKTRDKVLPDRVNVASLRSKNWRSHPVHQLSVSLRCDMQYRDDIGIEFMFSFHGCGEKLKPHPLAIA